MVWGSCKVRGMGRWYEVGSVFRCGSRLGVVGPGFGLHKWVRLRNFINGPSNLDDN